MEPTILGDRYRVVRELGRGGMGVVYVAHDPLLDREVAVKVLNRDSMSSGAAARFEREARVIARMDHPSIMNVFDIGHHDGSMYFVMPLVRGGSLRTRLDRGASIDPADVVEIAIQVAEALHYSHALGVVHRDVKPENILITPGEGSRGMRAVVTDFGLAVREGDDRLTQSGSIIGTVSYLSPEQVRDGDVDPRSDVYSLGVVLYETLSGDVPFKGPVHTVLYQVLHAVPRPLEKTGADIDRELATLVMSCLDKEPSRRPTAKELADKLRAYRFGSDEDITQELTRPPSDLPPLVGRNREMTQLIDALETIRSDEESQMILVAGEAGAGKTRLVEELVARAAGEHVRSYTGRFLGRDEGFPFQAYCDVLQEFLHSASEADVEERFSDIAADLVGLFPILSEIESLRRYAPARESARPSTSDRSALFELLTRAVIRIAGGRPLLLILEELHSAEVSIEALGYMRPRLAQHPILIIGTFRPQEVDRKHPLTRLIDDGLRDRRFALLRIEPFPVEEHRQLVEQLLHASISESLNERIYEITDGNPYFMRELLRTLIDSQKIVIERGRARFADEEGIRSDIVPENIQQAVEQRIDRLPESSRQVLSIASVIGRSFSFDDLESLVEDLDVDEIIDELTSAGFLREERSVRSDRFTFSSAVLREVLYAAIPRRRRRTLHRRYAELLEKRHGQRAHKVASELLNHYASADEPAKVVEYGLQFARKALESFSGGEVIRAARMVIDSVDETDEDRRRECEARLLLAAGERLEGRFDVALREADAAARIAEEIGASEQITAAAAFAADVAWESRRIEETRRWISRGLAVGDRTRPDDTRRLLSIGATLANLRGETEAAREFLRLAESLPQPALPAPVMSIGRGGTIRIPVGGELLTLDPTMSFTLAHAETLGAVFENLTRPTEDVRMTPWLASDVRVEDGGRRVDITLRDNIRFHDGRRVTAEDVRYSFERLLRNADAESRWILAPLEGARAFGERQADTIAGLRITASNRLVLTLTEPQSFFTAVLTHLPTAIVPAGTADMSGSWVTGCVGTGPFRVVDFDPGKELRLEANPFYWREGYPRADGLHFTFGVPPEEAYQGFVDGKFHVAADLHPQDLEALRDDPRFARNDRETPRLSTYYIAFNIHHGPLADEALRHQLVRALDVDGIVKTLGRLAVPAHGLIPPGLLGYEAGRIRPARRKESKRELIGLQAMLNSAYAGPYAPFAARLFEAIADAGFRIDVIEGKSEYYRSQAAALASSEILFTRWIADFPDAHNFMALLHSETGLVGKLCGVAEIDRLIEKGSREMRPESRHEIYREIEQIIAARALLLPLFHEQSYRIGREEVRDFAINYFSPILAYERMWLEE